MTLSKKIVTATSLALIAIPQVLPATTAFADDTTTQATQSSDVSTESTSSTDSTAEYTKTSADDDNPVREPYDNPLTTEDIMKQSNKTMPNTESPDENEAMKKDVQDETARKNAETDQEYQRIDRQTDTEIDHLLHGDPNKQILSRTRRSIDSPFGRDEYTNDVWYQKVKDQSQVLAKRGFHVNHTKDVNLGEFYQQDEATVKRQSEDDYRKTFDENDKQEKQYDQKIKKYQEDVKQVNRKNHDIDVRNNARTARYNAKMRKYNQDLDYYNKHKNDNGSIIGRRNSWEQPVVFNENSVNLPRTFINKNFRLTDDRGRLLNRPNTDRIETSFVNINTHWLTATYDNLDNANYHGKKIKKVVFRLRLSTNGKVKRNVNRASISFRTNPGQGWFIKATERLNGDRLGQEYRLYVDQQMTFYDEHDHILPFSENPKKELAGITVASLNRQTNPFWRVSEQVDVNTNEIEPNFFKGSTITGLNPRDGLGFANIRPSRDNNDRNDWDNTNPRVAWYGAALGIVKKPTNTLNMTIGVYSRVVKAGAGKGADMSKMWYYNTSTVYGTTKPMSPEKEPMEKHLPAPKKPQPGNISYHYNYYTIRKVKPLVIPRTGSNKGLFGAIMTASVAVIAILGTIMTSVLKKRSAQKDDLS